MSDGMNTELTIDRATLRGAARVLHRRLRIDGDFGLWSVHSEEDKQTWERDVLAVVHYLIRKGVVRQ